MADLILILYRRKGCCLCDALEGKLRSILLKDFSPSLELRINDIDSSNVSEEDHFRYNLEVPVLFIKGINSSQRIELPRSSPRLNDEGLKNWLQKIIYQKSEFL